MSTHIAAALFDMDGTLIDSKGTVEYAWCSVAHDYGIEVSQSQIDEHIHGRSGHYTLNYLFGHLDSAERERARQRVYAVEETAESDLIPGAISVLDYLSRHSIKIALVTAGWSERIEFIFSLHRLHKYFDVIISRHDVIHGKPNPEGYLLAAKKLGVDIKDCLVFEDSYSGLVAGIVSGACCVAIGDPERVFVKELSVQRFRDFRDYLPILTQDLEQ